MLDSEKHYWVGKDEVEKLLRKGEGWLARHPEKEAITERYLRFDRRLTREALARLLDDDAEDPEILENARFMEEENLEAPVKLWEQRVSAVLSALHTVEARAVVDLGCGEGKLLKALLEDRSFDRTIGCKNGNYSGILIRISTLAPIMSASTGCAGISPTSNTTRLAI